MAAVLIIDDDNGVRRMMRLALTKAGHAVMEASDGAAGLALFRRQPADLVITDLYMPNQDGIETIQQLREEFPSSRILAISGGAVLGTTDALTDASLFGADATLAKPFAADELVAAATRVLAT